MDDRIPPIATRGQHGGMRLVRPGEAVSDAYLIATWQMFRKTLGAVDVSLAASLAAGGGQPSLHSEALAKLAVSPGHKLPMSELAATLGMTSGGMTKLVDRLVQSGFVERQYSTTDRRVIYALLTPEGARHERRSTRVFVDRLRDEFQNLGPEGVYALRKVCRELRGGRDPSSPPRPAADRRGDDLRA